MAAITPEILLSAYGAGLFPMAERRDDPALYWVNPEQRGILPLNHLHIPRRLARTVRNGRFQVTADRDFRAVMKACAAPGKDRSESWINDTILDLYGALFDRGHAHSVECRRDGVLVGGLYGVSLGGAFFGESMFSRQRDASKVALVHLAARLVEGGYRLLDVQFLTGHLTQFGAIEVPRAAYRRLLEEAVQHTARFPVYSDCAPLEILQSVTHTS
ncbi:MAG: leucyl/phenylalanyl-tRNA--protein transferase [Alphaproteobacteria bacterium]